MATRFNFAVKCPLNVCCMSLMGSELEHKHVTACALILETYCMALEPSLDMFKRVR